MTIPEFIGACILVAMLALILVYAGEILVSALGLQRDPEAWHAEQARRQRDAARADVERRDREFLRRIRRINRSIDKADARRRKKFGLASARVVNVPRRRSP